MPDWTDYRPCETCHGKGKTPMGRVCPQCNGKAFVLPEQKPPMAVEPTVSPLRPGSKCPHSNIDIAEHILRRDGHISAYEAVYEVRCPFCGTIRRNTRLAATVHTLRHKRGWNIETVEKPGMLADYVLHQGAYRGGA